MAALVRLRRLARRRGRLGGDQGHVLEAGPPRARGRAPGPGCAPRRVARRAVLREAPGRIAAGAVHRAGRARRHGRRPARRDALPVRLPGPHAPRAPRTPDRRPSPPVPGCGRGRRRPPRLRNGPCRGCWAPSPIRCGGASRTGASCPSAARGRGADTWSCPAPRSSGPCTRPTGYWRWPCSQAPGIRPPAAWSTWPGRRPWTTARTSPLGASRRSGGSARSTRSWPPTSGSARGGAPRPTGSGRRSTPPRAGPASSRPRCRSIGTSSSWRSPGSRCASKPACPTRAGSATPSPRPGGRMRRSAAVEDRMDAERAPAFRGTGRGPGPARVPRGGPRTRRGGAAGGRRRDRPVRGARPRRRGCRGSGVVERARGRPGQARAHRHAGSRTSAVLAGADRLRPGRRRRARADRRRGRPGACRRPLRRRRRRLRPLRAGR